MSVPYFPGLLEEEQMPAPSMMGVGAPQMAGPSAMPMPPQAPPKLSLFDRFKMKMSQGLGTPTPPPGMEGMMTPDMMKQARGRGLLDFGLSMLESSGPVVGAPAPSMGQALGRAGKAGMASYDNALQQNMQQGLLADQQKQQQAMQQSRAQIQQKFAPRPGASPEEVEASLKGMFAEFVRNGDTEMVGRLAQVMPSLQRGEQAGTDWQDFGGYKALVDKATGKELRRVEKTPSPRDPNAPDTAQQMRDQRMFAREQQLTDDFNKDTKDSREMANKVAGAIAEAPAAKAGDGIAQVNLLYAFISAMDPGTAVREGEIGLVRSAGSLVQQAQGLLAKYGQGQAITVPPAMVDQLAGLMQRRLEGAKKYVDSRAKYYSGRAKYWKLENADKLFPGFDVPSAGAPGRPTTGNPLLNR